MRKSDKVQRYLRQLERELAEMPADHRDRVLTEIKDQIKRGLAGDRSAAAVLREIGSPKLIAMSHMKIRTATGEPRSPWLRIAAVATVVFFGLVFAFGLHWIRQNANRRSRAAAAVDPAAALPTDAPEDSRNLREFNVHVVVIPFGTGRLTLNSGAGESLTWRCDGAPRVEVLANVLTLNLDRISVARCEVSVPAGVKVKIRGTNGQLEVNQPRTPLDITLTNGRVSLRPDPARSYDYDVRVKNGLQDFFRASSRPGALKIKIAVTNGTVKKE